jgi:hypothetical protein
MRLRWLAHSLTFGEALLRRVPHIGVIGRRVMSDTRLPLLERRGSVSAAGNRSPVCFDADRHSNGFKIQLRNVD